MMNTQQTIDQFFSHFSQGQLDEMLALFATDFEFEIAVAPHVPWNGPRTSIAELRAFFESFGHTDTEAFNVEQTILQGEDAVILGRSRFRVKATGKAFDNVFALHIRIVNGKIARYHMYEDSFAIAEAFTA